MKQDHPYSAARSINGFIFVSGALSVDPSGQAVPGRRQALDAALERMTERLATVGGTLSEVVKLTYFATDVTLRDEANEQFRDIFADSNPPARTFVEVSSLPYGASVEIDCIAVS